MIELYKNGDSMAIVTDAPDERSFLSELAELWGDMIDSGIFEHDWEFQLDYWLPSVVDICCKYRGYKNDVLIKHLLCAGSIPIFPNDIPLVGKIIDGKIIDLSKK